MCNVAVSWQIMLKLREKHRTLCYEYKNAISLEEVNVWCTIIHCWWYSSDVDDEAGL
jgi:hypothetical protein